MAPKALKAPKTPSSSATPLVLLLPVLPPSNPPDTFNVHPQVDDLGGPTGAAAHTQAQNDDKHPVTPLPQNSASFNSTTAKQYWANLFKPTIGNTSRTSMFGASISSNYTDRVIFDENTLEQSRQQWHACLIGKFL